MMNSRAILNGLRQAVDELYSKVANAAGGQESGFVSVRAFGAVGDGVHDDTEAIARAFDTSAPRGIAVWFPAGTYVVSTPIPLPNELIVWGDAAATILSRVTPIDGFSGSAFIAQVTARVTDPTGTLAATPTLGGEVLSVNLAAPPAVGNGILVTNQNNGNDALVYDVVRVTGSGPYTVTVERPIVFPFQSADVVTVLADYPKDIAFFGNGMRFVGTGDRYIEIATSARCVGRDLVFDGTTSAGTISGLAASFDIGGRQNVWLHCTANLTGTTGSIDGIVLESQEGSLIFGCTTIGVPSVGQAIFDSAYSAIARAESGGAGPAAFGFQIGVNDGAGSYGSFDCEIASSWAHDVGIGCQSAVVNANTRNKITDVTLARCVTGLQTNGTGWTYAVNVATPNCTTQGVLVNAGAPLRAQNLNVDNCFNGINANDFIDIDGLSCLLHVNSGVTLASGGRISHFDTSTAGAFVAFDLAGRCELSHGKSAVTGVQGIIVEPASVLILDDAVVSGASGRAVFVEGTLRQGIGCDFSGSAAGVVLNAGAFSNRKQTVIANGATPVAIAWSDAKATDVLQLALQTAGGTVGHPTYTVTPGTGFTVTSQALDTSTYEYFIP